MKKIYPHTKIGDQQTKRGFLFLPKRIGLVMRWLEWASWTQVFLAENWIGGGGWIDRNWTEDQ